MPTRPQAARLHRRLAEILATVSVFAFRRGHPSVALRDSCRRPQSLPLSIRIFTTKPGGSTAQRRFAERARLLCKSRFLKGLTAVESRLCRVTKVHHRSVTINE